MTKHWIEENEPDVTSTDYIEIFRKLLMNGQISFLPTYEISKEKKYRLIEISLVPTKLYTGTTTIFFDTEISLSEDNE